MKINYMKYYWLQIFSTRKRCLVTAVQWHFVLSYPLILIHLVIKGVSRFVLLPHIVYLFPDDYSTLRVWKNGLEHCSLTTMTLGCHGRSRVCPVRSIVCHMSSCMWLSCGITWLLQDLVMVWASLIRLWLVYLVVCQLTLARGLMVFLSQKQTICYSATHVTLNSHWLFKNYRLVEELKGRDLWEE